MESTEAFVQADCELSEHARAQGYSDIGDKFSCEIRCFHEGHRLFAFEARRLL